MKVDILKEFKELRKENTSEKRRLYDVIFALNALKSEDLSYIEENQALRKVNRTLIGRLSVLNSEHFGGSKTQKGVSKKF